MSTHLEVPEMISDLPEALKPMRERLVANLVMIAQIPAPTGNEAPRVRFLLDRFGEAGLRDAAVDDAGNAVGRLAGTRGHRTILLVSHLDTIFPATQSHQVTVEADRVIGPGVGDNALGAGNDYNACHGGADTPVFDRAVLIDPFDQNGNPVYDTPRNITGVDPF